MTDKGKKSGDISYGVPPHDLQKALASYSLLLIFVPPFPRKVRLFFPRPSDPSQLASPSVSGGLNYHSGDGSQWLLMDRAY
jgi:hypothetical protein